MRSQEYAERTLTVATAAVGDTEPDRVTYLADFLTAASLYMRPDETWLNLLWRYLARLSGSHMLTLFAYYDRQRGLPASDRLGTRELRNVPVAVDGLKAVGLDPQLLLIASSDLEKVGLLADWRTINGGARPPKTSYALTRNGMFFIRYMNRDWGAAPGLTPVD